MCISQFSITLKENGSKTTELSRLRYSNSAITLYEHSERWYSITKIRCNQVTTWKVQLQTSDLLEGHKQAACIRSALICLKSFIRYPAHSIQLMSLAHTNWNDLSCIWTCAPCTKKWGGYCSSFVATLHLLHTGCSVTKVQEASSHENSLWAKSRSNY